MAQNSVDGLCRRALLLYRETFQSWAPQLALSFREHDSEHIELLRQFGQRALAPLLPSP